MMTTSTKDGIRTTVEYGIDHISGKEYPKKITRQYGFQRILKDGKWIDVEQVTLVESELGNTFMFTYATPEGTPEEYAANKKHIQEAFGQAVLAIKPR